MVAKPCPALSSSPSRGGFGGQSLWHLDLSVALSEFLESKSQQFTFQELDEESVTVRNYL